MFKVLVCGGRDYTDKETLYSVLDNIGPTRIIQGGAKGADILAVEYAYDHDIALQTYLAEWDKHGKSAGPIRNQRMLDKGKPHLVVAFPGGVGTADMVTRARKAGVPVMEV